jgi:queuine/archaeosine tRNA-ribosyltransferase
MRGIREAIENGAFESFRQTFVRRASGKAQ